MIHFVRAPFMIVAFVFLSSCEPLTDALDGLGTICRNPIEVNNPQNLPSYRNAQRGDIEICDGETPCTFIVAMRTAELCGGVAPQTILLAPGSVHILNGEYKGSAGGLVFGELTIRPSGPGKAPEIRHTNSDVPLFTRGLQGVTRPGAHITLEDLKITGTRNEQLFDSSRRSLPATLNNTELADMENPNLGGPTDFNPLILRNIRGDINIGVVGDLINAVVQDSGNVRIFASSQSKNTPVRLNSVTFDGNDSVRIEVSDNSFLDITGTSRFDNNDQVLFSTGQEAKLQLSGTSLDGNVLIDFYTGQGLQDIFSDTFLNNVTVANTDTFNSTGAGFGAQIIITDSQFRDVQNIDFYWFGGNAEGLNEITRSSFSGGSRFEYRAGYPSEIQTRFTGSTISDSEVRILIEGDDGSPSNITLDHMTFADNGPITLEAAGDAGITVGDSLFYTPNATVDCRKETSSEDTNSTIVGTVLIDAESIGPSGSNCAFQRGIDQPRLMRQDGGAYYLPRANSPAVNTADTTCPSPDQLGGTRPVGAACDVGAVERP